LLPGEPSLPSMIARGDLDGDNYFVCWNTELLDQINPVEPVDGEFDDGIMQMCPRNPNWLSDVQRQLADSSRLSRIFDLVGTLCTKRKILVRDCGLECPDAAAFGLAYKDALEVEKHGKKVRLPLHLWKDIPAYLHCLLGDSTTGETCQCTFQNDASRHKATKKSKRSSKAASRNNEPTMGDSGNAHDYVNLSELEEGAPVEITGGKYNTQLATFVRLTAKMVRIKLCDQSQKETCISQKYVRPVRSKH